MEIHDTVLIAAAFCMFNRYVDGLATIAPEDPALLRRRGAAHRQAGLHSTVSRSRPPRLITALLPQRPGRPVMPGAGYGRRSRGAPWPAPRPAGPGRPARPGTAAGPGTGNRCPTRTGRPVAPRSSPISSGGRGGAPSPRCRCTRWSCAGPWRPAPYAMASRNARPPRSDPGGRRRPRQAGSGGRSRAECPARRAGGPLIPLVPVWNRASRPCRSQAAKTGQ